MEELKDWIKFTKMQHHNEIAIERWEGLKQRENKLVSRSDFDGDKNFDPNGLITWEKYRRIHYGANPGI